MKPMETIQDLIEEAKLRTVWWGLCIFCVTYFLSHTSKSMLMNIPVAILLVSALRILFNEVEFCQKHRPIPANTYLSLLEKKQIPVNDARISSPPPPANWKSKIDSPVVEAAANQFIDKILKEFVIDLWYSEITADRDFPEQIRGIILDAIGEIAVRVKEINLVDILTRDIVDMIGDHIDVFRRIQAAIGTDVMGTLSSEERDERLKYHLTVSKELHPALASPGNEYKVLQRLIGGLIASVLRPRESQVPVVRSIARELVTCLVVQPLLNFANPAFVNEILELVFLALKVDVAKIFGFGGDQLVVNVSGQQDLSTGSKKDADVSGRKATSISKEHTDALLKTGHQRGLSLDCNMIPEEKHPKASEWARGLEAATLRRTEVLMPENLENMWSKGRNYKRKEAKKAKKVEGPHMAGPLPNCDHGKEHACRAKKPFRSEEKCATRLNPSSILDNPRCLEIDSREEDSSLDKKELFLQTHSDNLLKGTSTIVDNGKRSRLKRSNSLSALKSSPESKNLFTRDCARLIKFELYSPNLGEKYKDKNVSDTAYSSDGLHPSSSKLRCRVMGAYFDKLESKSFAVYSIAVTDTESRAWFVMRRYSNFEQLHRQLKEIPNYILHLPPKRIFSSSTEDSFVHQRCIQLDKYLQDLLSIANVAEQHEVWDFLSASSKNYSFGMSSLEMRTLAVHVDDAVDDIVRHFKGVSNDVMRSIMGHAPSPSEPSDSNSGMNLSCHADDPERYVSRQSTADTLTSASDSEEVYRDGNHEHEEQGGMTIMAAEWHSDNELNFKVFPPRVVKRGEGPGSLKSRIRQSAAIKSELTGKGSAPAVRIPTSSNPWGYPDGMPPEWAPPNVCVPMLNLVDKVFQLKRRGWLRRQVFWMSKQILQLVMEDAIDDWLLGQIQWLRNAETIAQGIQWAQDLLWPGGKFFISLRNNQTNVERNPLNGKLFDHSQFGSGRVSKHGTFELQLEAARRASDVKKMLFNGAPTALVSLVGPKQYKRCARDIYYFSQSTICIKQLTYGIVELLLVSVFPELRELVADVRHQMAPHTPEKGAEQA